MNVVLALFINVVGLIVFGILEGTNTQPNDIPDEFPVFNNKINFLSLYAWLFFVPITFVLAGWIGQTISLLLKGNELPHSLVPLLYIKKIKYDFSSKNICIVANEVSLLMIAICWVFFGLMVPKDPLEVSLWGQWYIGIVITVYILFPIIFIPYLVAIILYFNVELAQCKL
ncbi:hypothetical protein ACNQ2O_02985 [Mycoplasma sp. AA7A]|uniref:hypothetical protein n=1 Tax=Mycoplasma sp. AA7A TaxID=3401665 RepID=UPI003AAFE32C